MILFWWVRSRLFISFEGIGEAKWFVNVSTPPGMLMIHLGNPYSPAFPLLPIPSFGEVARLAPSRLQGMQGMMGRREAVLENIFSLASEGR